MAPYAYRPFAEADRDELARILGLAFVQSTADSRGWIEKNDTAHARVVTAGGRVVGGLFLLPMGQWFGARSVPMTGIAAVGVDPPARSEGAATFLMRETVGELAAQGVALSALYASTQPLYRRAGYEQAGQLYRCKMATARIFSNDRTLRVRALGDADEDEVLRLHREHGRTNPGTLERSARMWERVREGMP